MVLFPNAKINLGLNIITKRTDGFHAIETCFVPIELCDIVEFIEDGKKTSIVLTGIDLPGNPKENICFKAWELLHADFKIPTIQIHLHKLIPIGAGLGGGSSDAAFMLKGLNNYFSLGLTQNQLEQYASTLGSDCAFFIRNAPAFAEGRGEILNPVTLDLSEYKIIVVNPGIHISTQEAYSSVLPKKPDVSLTLSLAQPINTWKQSITNDFEHGVFLRHPEIPQIKELLYIHGAEYSSMSGSGSSVYGIFRGDLPKQVLGEFKNMFVWVQE